MVGGLPITHCAATLPRRARARRRRDRGSCRCGPATAMSTRAGEIGGIAGGHVVDGRDRCPPTEADVVQGLDAKPAAGANEPTFATVKHITRRRYHAARDGTYSHSTDAWRAAAQPPANLYKRRPPPARGGALTRFMPTSEPVPTRRGEQSLRGRGRCVAAIAHERHAGDPEEAEGDAVQRLQAQDRDRRGHARQAASSAPPPSPARARTARGAPTRQRSPTTAP